MPKKTTDIKSKSTRKPLRDVSNGVKPSKSVKKKSPENEDRAGGDALDRLILVHSDLSTLIHQIDELVVQALKVTSQKGREEIESFAHVLSEMQTSLKPWVPRFQKALSSPSIGSENQLEQSLSSKTVCAVNKDVRKVADSPDQMKWDLLVSPSPLVSWHAECTTESGRQLFLLTPLPRPKTFSSKLKESSKLVFEKITTATTVGPSSHFAISGDTNDDLLEGVVVKPTPSKLSDSFAINMEGTMECGFVSPTKCSKWDCSMLAMTPCLRMSPPKSCVLLEPISELSHRNNHGVRKLTPFPVGVQNFSGSQDTESSSSQVSEHLALKYPELFGLKPAHKLGNGRKVVEESPNWLMSPPKTCILMEPPDEKSLTTAATNCQLPVTACPLNQQSNFSLMKKNDIQGCHILTKKSCHEELGGTFTVTEMTPMWKEPESTIRTGKHPGENTLKKELWSKFEAASSRGIRLNVSVHQESAPKGFLDLLEEVSCDETKFST